jgi:hypothetical protein
MRRQEIDEAILVNLGTAWTKVALVVVRVADESGLAFSEDEDDFEVVANHIEQLANEGRLIAQGDIKDWRHCEIRKP